jgi:hypothetical protein
LFKFAENGFHSVRSFNLQSLVMITHDGALSQWAGKGRKKQ